ncbi:hypothetical protein CJ030_MR3G020086 [Morella rubra]|uniref:Uncharacterized protein n=1 Tax=Morella rubra TaxID=262757 RepID=A0A6A1W403_9ROSI|nr:hypothetical protein CJ030_MR3G020086 [Morella rubra]
MAYRRRTEWVLTDLYHVTGLVGSACLRTFDLWNGGWATSVFGDAGCQDVIMIIWGCVAPVHRPCPGTAARDNGEGSDVPASVTYCGMKAIF